MAKKEETLFVNLTLKINEDISSPVPFDLKVMLAGTFKTGDGAPLDTIDQKTQVGEVFSVLYPYLRSIVSSLTVNCNIPAYILPSVDPEQLIEGDGEAKKNNLN